MVPRATSTDATGKGRPVASVGMAIRISKTVNQRPRRMQPARAGRLHPSGWPSRPPPHFFYRASHVGPYVAHMGAYVGYMVATCWTYGVYVGDMGGYMWDLWGHMCGTDGGHMVDIWGNMWDIWDMLDIRGLYGRHMGPYIEHMEGGIRGTYGGHLLDIWGKVWGLWEAYVHVSPGSAQLNGR